MMEHTIFSNINISLLPMLFLCGIVGIGAPACSSTNQVQQSGEQQATEADSTALPQTQAETDEDREEERVKALKEKYREQLRDDYQAQANEITTFYLLAQRRFYNGDYRNALSIVNKALKIRENADLYALKGSIYLGLNNIEQFKKNWRTALKMDKQVPLPLTDFVIEQLKEHGLLNENLERNF